MARTLKTFVTSIGFYDLAIAAPSMKAALEAWGSNRNLFHQGLAEETNDAAIVAATRAHPGIVLRRLVGSTGAYKEKPDAPQSLPVDAPKARPPKAKVKSKAVKVKAKRDNTADKAAILSFEKAKAKRDAARQQEEARAGAQREKDKARIKRALAKVDESLERAKTKHEEALAAINEEREDLDRREAAERKRWEAEREKLNEARRHATE